ncbi:hypothetical protein BB559_003285 [Furculomyces boomerangus]|uniref:Alpha/beta hydrolase fold-3 domain-containing protein n=1 Tax=Furculomyces boomerangus TaxID=61424 RepID=A0A2T9YMB3_9FUNG|nr:hypothetical protein BB559_003285 [Furculomyces boomerangus]
MTDLAIGILRGNKTPEQEKKIEALSNQLLTESIRSFIRDGPKQPNWNIGMQVSSEMVKVAYGSVGYRNIAMTEDNFDVNFISQVLKPLRTTEIEIESRGGDHRRHQWEISSPNLFDSPDPMFVNLARSDKECSDNGSPRKLFAEVVSSKEFIKNTSQSLGISYEDVLDIKPLNENEVILVHYHGGAFVNGNPSVYRRLFLRLHKETGLRVIGPTYRLAPENPFPAGIYDCFLFFKYLINQGFKAENIIIQGDSAGANIVLVLLLILKQVGAKQPRGAIALCPGPDHSLDRSKNTENVKYDYIPGSNFDSIMNSILLYTSPGKKMNDEIAQLLKHPFNSPVYGNFDGCAPIYIHSGQVETLSDDTDTFAKTIGAKETVIRGREHPGFNTDDRNIYEKYFGMIHVFHLIEDSDECYSAAKGIGNFVKRLEGL